MRGEEWKAEKKEVEEVMRWCLKNVTGLELAEPQGLCEERPANNNCPETPLSTYSVSLMNQAPPTPPATQAPEQAPIQMYVQRVQPARHPKFYCTALTLTDGVVRQVCHQLISFCLIVTSG